MDLPDPLQRAFQRLTAALDALEAAAERRTRADARAAAPDGSAGLAAELDAALARNRALEHAAGEAAVRVERAGAAVRSVLSELSAPPGAA